MIFWITYGITVAAALANLGCCWALLRQRKVLRKQLVELYAAQAELEALSDNLRQTIDLQQTAEMLQRARLLDEATNIVKFKQ